MTTPDRDQLQELCRALLSAARDIHELIKEPLAPDVEVQAWPLYAGEYGGGGIWCGDDDCPLTVHNSEIGEFREEIFTLKQLHEAIAEHIAARREREADEAYDEPA